MSETLSSPSFRPLYEQIKILLTQSLVAGEWKPGEAIPSEMELAARFDHAPYRRYPVLDGQRLVGQNSRRDVLRALIALW